MTAAATKNRMHARFDKDSPEAGTDSPNVPLVHWRPLPIPAMRSINTASNVGPVISFPSRLVDGGSALHRQLRRHSPEAVSVKSGCPTCTSMVNVSLGRSLTISAPATKTLRWRNRPTQSFGLRMTMASVLVSLPVGGGIMRICSHRRDDHEFERHLR
jgi:hypothetical protein